VVVNGAGARLAQTLHDTGMTVATRVIGIPVEFLNHGKVADVRKRIGLTPQGISRRIIEFAAAALGPADGNDANVAADAKWSINAETQQD
jgi:deoxyxylulose-5-phosphate synthase